MREQERRVRDRDSECHRDGRVPRLSSLHNSAKNIVSEPTQTRVCSKRILLHSFLFSLSFFLLLPSLAQGTGDEKARKVIDAAVTAMGGDAYLKVRNSHSSGRFFFFRKGRKGFTRFRDWTVYDPVKSRFERGKNEKEQHVSVHNLELNKGWTLEGEFEVEEIPGKELDSWIKSVRKDLNFLIKQRLDEDGMSLYYYGPDDIAGQGKFKAVEFLDASNNSVVAFFNVNSHLPEKVENEFTDDTGLRHKMEWEFYNWHAIQGVHTPLRTDIYLDGKISQQLFVEDLAYNLQIPESQFLEPAIDQKKKAKWEEKMRKRLKKQEERDAKAAGETEKEREKRRKGRRND